VNFERFSAFGGRSPQTPHRAYYFLVSSRSLKPASSEFHVRIGIFAAKVPA